MCVCVCVSQVSGEDAARRAAANMLRRVGQGGLGEAQDEQAAMEAGGYAYDTHTHTCLHTHMHIHTCLNTHASLPLHKCVCAIVDMSVCLI